MRLPAFIERNRTLRRARAGVAATVCVIAGIVAGETLMAGVVETAAGALVVNPVGVNSPGGVTDTSSFVKDDNSQRNGEVLWLDSAGFGVLALGAGLTARFIRRPRVLS